MNQGINGKQIEFFMPMVPPECTHQEKKVRVVNGKPVFYEPENVKAARSKLTAHLAKHRPAEPFREPVGLSVQWLFPRGKHRDGEYRGTKPDTDNLQKMLKDIMTHLHYWTDDALVASECVEKRWAEVPGIYIRIQEL